MSQQETIRLTPRMRINEEVVAESSLNKVVRKTTNFIKQVVLFHIMGFCVFGAYCASVVLRYDVTVSESQSPLMPSIHHSKHK